MLRTPEPSAGADLSPTSRRVLANMYECGCHYRLEQSAKVPGDRLFDDGGHEACALIYDDHHRWLRSRPSVTIPNMSLLSACDACYGTTNRVAQDEALGQVT